MIPGLVNHYGMKDITLNLESIDKKSIFGFEEDGNFVFNTGLTFSI